MEVQMSLLQQLLGDALQHTLNKSSRFNSQKGHYLGHQQKQQYLISSCWEILHCPRSRSWESSSQ